MTTNSDRYVGLFADDNDFKLKIYADRSLVVHRPNSGGVIKRKGQSNYVAYDLSDTKFSDIVDHLDGSETLFRVEHATLDEKYVMRPVTC